MTESLDFCYGTGNVDDWIVQQDLAKDLDSGNSKALATIRQESKQCESLDLQFRREMPNLALRIRLFFVFFLFFYANAFEAEGDRDVVANPPLHFGHAEFASLDREFRKESRSLLAKWTPAGSHQAGRQQHGTSLTKNGQVRGDLVFVSRLFQFPSFSR